MQNRKWMRWGVGCLLAGMLAGCANDDYVFPPVKKEFVTVTTDSRGLLDALQPDRGDLLPVENDHTAAVLTPDTVLRMVANYEVTPEHRAVVYGMARALSPVPQPRHSKVFEQGIKTDPVQVESVWMGRGYLNMVLLVKVRTALHYFHFVEEQAAETGECLDVTLSLYHDDGGDREGYTQRVYASVPLHHYLQRCPKVSVRFCYRSEHQTMVEMGPYEYEQ